MVYSYDANKKPLKAKGTMNGGILEELPITIDFSFKNGRQNRQVLKMGVQGSLHYVETTFEFNYDKSGKRTSTKETDTFAGTRYSFRTYHSDGTLQKVTSNGYNGFPNTGFTYTFAWENGKTTVNFDDYAAY